MNTELEKQGVSLAALVLSYSPESQFANLCPGLYGLMFRHVYFLMRTVGIEPHENIRCWFWQLDQYTTGDDASEQIQKNAAKPAPYLNDVNGSWEYPKGTPISDDEFCRLFPNGLNSPDFMSRFWGDLVRLNASMRHSPD